MAQLTPAFILRRNAFRDNSLLLDMFTVQEGRLSAIARLSKKHDARLRGMLEPFRLLDASWLGRGEVFTLAQTEERGRYRLHGEALLQAMYLNELLLRAFPPLQAVPDLFQHYRLLLFHLQQGADLCRVMQFELAALAHCGYVLNLWQDDASGQAIDPQMRYRFHPDTGLTPLMLGVPDVPTTMDTVLSGRLLLGLRDMSALDTAQWQELRRVLDRLWHVWLAGKTLYARPLLNEVIQ